MSNNLLQKYAGRSSEERNAEPFDTEVEGQDNLGAFGWLRGTRDRALMLELRKKDGNIIAMGYAWLERAEFDPSVGITLNFSGRTIRIKGLHLNTDLRPNVRLYEGIVRHRVPWIQEADQPTAMESQGKNVLVDRIEW